ncbi:uncharacterized protein LOC130934272 [Arachis stenosperma]|uniref:uncharacterized protein LOC130934272 n=1 Tax=Arachis stenosperma TaxID=217475 RepID=UPI0025AD1F59|nr:uncharacterized protein LOC130934272 [Arachis stenosperma]
MTSQHLTGMQTAPGSNQEASFEEEAYDPDQLTMEEVNYMGEAYGNTYNPSWNMETSKQSLSDLATLVSSLTKTTHSFINETRSSIRNLEVQVGQLSKRIPEIPPNNLSNNTEVNPREEFKAITMEVEAELEENGKALNASEEAFIGRSTPNQAAILVLNVSEEPLTGSSMPTSPGKLLVGTKPLEEEPLPLTKELHALVQQELLQKLLDPGHFLIPCTIGPMTFKKALCNLGSSINLMPLSVIEKLGILKVQAAHVSLEMADKTMKKPYGLVEDVLVKVENHYISVNFIVLDIGKDEDDYVILGRPFLATTNAIIDVAKGELTLKLGKDHILFKMPHPTSPLKRR